MASSKTKNSTKATPSTSGKPTDATSPPKVFTAPEHRATKEDIQKWQGWCKLPSEPSIFNTMLRKLEVKGVRVTDVHDLDSLTEQLDPIFGLLFLFPYRQLDDDEDEEEASETSSKLWFANQTTENACATIGLVNMLCNIPGIDRSDFINTMMDYTESFAPPLRGFILSSWPLLRNLHNSYCTKADMLLADSCMKRDFTKASNQRKARANLPSTTSSTSTSATTTQSARKRKAMVLEEEEHDDDDDDDNEPGEYHFMGYVPFAGHVWRLDGLDASPHDLGPYPQDNEDKAEKEEEKEEQQNDDEGTPDDPGRAWVAVARANIRRYMATASPDDAFNLTRLGPDPLLTKTRALRANVRALRRVEARLDALEPEWRGQEGVSAGAVPELGASEEELAVEREEEDEEYEEEIEELDVEGLVGLRERLGREQREWRDGVKEAKREWEEDERRAEERRFDFGPFIRGFLRRVAERGRLREIVEDL
ncbi:MAG: hypothetical protein Q9165_005688 [Trypethelium subeluteriae]